MAPQVSEAPATPGPAATIPGWAVTAAVMVIMATVGFGAHQIANTIETHRATSTAADDNLRALITQAEQQLREDQQKIQERAIQAVEVLRRELREVETEQGSASKERAARMSAQLQRMEDKLTDRLNDLQQFTLESRDIGKVMEQRVLQGLVRIETLEAQIDTYHSNRRRVQVEIVNSDSSPRRTHWLDPVGDAIRRQVGSPGQKTPQFIDPEAGD